VKKLFALSILFVAVPVLASGVSLKSEVWVVRQSTDSNGKPISVLETPKTLNSGDTLHHEIRSINNGTKPEANTVITNPLPNSLAFVSASDVHELSVDGGRTWGQLETLLIKMSDGRMRSATKEDVTHIRWRIVEPLAIGAEVRRSFRTRVREP
jgi:uncharacterized repeat protein (TIGR01451 family)